jgi:hypothetical protein
MACFCHDTAKGKAIVMPAPDKRSHLRELHKNLFADIGKMGVQC